MPRFIERHSPPWPVDLSTNYVCREMKGALPPEWGIFSSLTSLIQKPRLVHYCLEVPNKTKFNRSYGFRDITAVWMYFVRWTLGLSVTEACGVPLWKWILGRLYCHLLRAKLALLLCLPRFHTLAREKQYSMTFLHGDQRRLLSRQFWMTR